jgi:transcriptional regulator with XRE-family HTH domain
MSKTELARRSGVHLHRLAEYESGTRLPNGATLERLLVALDCDLHDLADALDLVSRRAPKAGAPPMDPQALAALGLEDLPPEPQQALAHVVQALRLLAAWVRKS